MWISKARCKQLETEEEKTKRMQCTFSSSGSNACSWNGWLKKKPCALCKLKEEKESALRYKWRMKKNTFRRDGVKEKKKRDKSAWWKHGVLVSGCLHPPAPPLLLSNMCTHTHTHTHTQTHADLCTFIFKPTPPFSVTHLCDLSSPPGAQSLQHG